MANITDSSDIHVEKIVDDSTSWQDNQVMLFDNAIEKTAKADGLESSTHGEVKKERLGEVATNSGGDGESGTADTSDKDRGNEETKVEEPGVAAHGDGIKGEETMRRETLENDAVLLHHPKDEKQNVPCNLDKNESPGSLAATHENSQSIATENLTTGGEHEKGSEITLKSKHCETIANEQELNIVPEAALMNSVVKENKDKSDLNVVVVEGNKNKSDPSVVVEEENKDKPSASVVVDEENKDKPSASVVVVEDKPDACVVVVEENKDKPSASVVVEEENEDKPSASAVVEEENKDKPSASVVVEEENKDKPSASVVVEEENEDKPSASVVVEEENKDKPSASVVVEEENKDKPSASAVVEEENKDKPSASVVVEEENKDTPDPSVVVVEDKPRASEVVVEENKDKPDASEIVVEGNIQKNEQEYENQDKQASHSRVEDNEKGEVILKLKSATGIIKIAEEDLSDNIQSVVSPAEPESNKTDEKKLTAETPTIILDKSEEVDNSDGKRFEEETVDNASVLEVGHDSETKTVSDALQGKSNVSGENTVSADSGIGAEDAGVIHVLTSDEEDEKLAPISMVAKDGEDDVECSIQFSDVQCNLKKQLDGENSGPVPKVTKSSRTIAALTDKEVCYGDGTFCVECGKVFSLQSYFSDHISSHYVGAISALGQCALCGLIFTNSFTRSEHLVSAHKRMETAMKIIKWNGLFSKRKQSKSKSNSKWITVESDEDVNSDSGESNTSPNPVVEQAAAVSPPMASENQNQQDLELPDGAKRKRKAPEKFVSDPSPTFKRRKSARETGSTKTPQPGTDPEVEAYLLGLVKEGLTVDPAALGVKPKSSAAKVPSPEVKPKSLAAKQPSLNNKSIIHGFHDVRNTVVNKNGTVCITLGNTGGDRPSTTLPSQTRRIPVISALSGSAHIPNNVLVDTSKAIPFNKNVCFVPAKVQGNTPRFSPFQNTGKHAVSLLSNINKTTVKSAPPHVSVPTSRQPGWLSNNSRFSIVSQQPKSFPGLSTKAHFVLRTALASSPRIQDARIERLRRKRLSRKDLQGCKRVRNVGVKLKRLVMPPVSRGQWPVWRLNPPSSQPHASLQTSWSTRTTNILQRQQQNPVKPQQQQSLLQRVEHRKRKPLDVDPRSLYQSVPLPVVKLKKIHEATSLDLKNGNPALSSPKLSNLSPTAPVLTQILNASAPQRSKEQSRNVVEAMLQSLAIPSLTQKPNNVRNNNSTISSLGNSSLGGSKRSPQGELTSSTRLMKSVPIRQGFRGVEVSSKVSTSLDEVIVIDDDEEEKKGDGGKRQSADSLTSQTPSSLQGSTISKNTVEVREISSSEPSVIVALSSASDSSHQGKVTPLESSNPCEREDKDAAFEENDGSALKDDQDFFGWKVCVAKSPEDSDDEDPDNEPSKIQPGVVSLSETEGDKDSKSQCNTDIVKTTPKAAELTTEEKNEQESENDEDTARDHTQTKLTPLPLSDPQVCRTLSQTEVVSIPAHLENSSNIQDIFSEIEKTCREMQENSENDPGMENDSKGNNIEKS